ncbi:transcription termination factor 3, mitochondrial [Plutella xylostella]|uniref:transcription termination factor 3, mitochondrial n=1 Tax=Plutella xylostella TaxID=51655 RepID=UPI0020330C6C|nr:transcription termination factor 3, mitochondrial [Plutella xylostella]
MSGGLPKSMFPRNTWITYKCLYQYCRNMSVATSGVVKYEDPGLHPSTGHEDPGIRPSSGNKDLSSVTPHFPNAFNIAAYVNSSETLKKLIDLNVDLSKIEKKPYVAVKLLKLDFEKDMKEHIIFLLDHITDPNLLGPFITKNPLIFNESIIDLEVRVNYLVSKRFSKNQINQIVTKNPYWLNFSTMRIDRRLGFHQDHFKLTGDEVRQLTVTQPKIITYNLQHIKTNSFAIREEMGFDDKEIKALLLKKPKLWLMNQISLLHRFNLIHNELGISHKTILQYPQILECRKFRIKQRHSFLEKLGRAQYDPTKENFVPIMALAEGTDTDFCKKYAKCSVSDYNLFLKTL